MKYSGRLGSVEKHSRGAVFADERDVFGDLVVFFLLFLVGVHGIFVDFVDSVTHD